MLRYKINKISEIEKDKLPDFYKKAYPHRYKSLSNNWKWWYRTEKGGFEPLIISTKDKIIGQAGLIPVDLKIKERKIKAIWFVDFAILPEFRGKGYGQILTKEWMKICPNQITFCNNQSLKIFHKFGWENNLSTKRLLYPLNPLKFLPIIKKFDLNFSRKILGYYIKRKFDKGTCIKPYSINDNFKAISESFKTRKIADNNETAEIVRDDNWLNWRLVECPYNKSLYFFEYDNNFALVHIFSKNNLKRINIIYTYFINEQKKDKLFLLILNWAIENNVDLMWLINSSKKLENIFPKLFNKALNFTVWSSDKNISETLKKGLPDAQGIDSDIDSSLHVE